MKWEDKNEYSIILPSHLSGCLPIFFSQFQGFQGFFTHFLDDFQGF